jgi:hypothetical protein
MTEPRQPFDSTFSEVQFVKCPSCQGNGGIWCIEYTLKENPSNSLFRDVTESEANNFYLDDWPDYDAGEVFYDKCFACNTVGWVKIT